MGDSETEIQEVIREDDGLKWSTKNESCITSSKEPTCAAVNGKSTPDIIMADRVRVRAVTLVDVQ